MIRAEKFKIGHVILTTPLSGTVCHPQSWTHYVNLPIIYLQSLSISYKDMKVEDICRNWGDLRV